MTSMALSDGQSRDLAVLVGLDEERRLVAPERRHDEGGTI
jgi:hypothetical protein